MKLDLQSRRKAAKSILLGVLIFTLISMLTSAQDFAGSQLQNALQTQARTGSVIAQPGASIGDDACASCHAEKAETYSHTAHHQTSHRASKESIAGSFADGANVLRTANPGLFFKMESTEEGLYQEAVWGVPPVTSTRKEKFDIVIGSGRKGQSFLFWRGNDLYQLPVSYWVELGAWVNSPGFRDGVADFERPVIPRCFECHATYIQVNSGPPPLNHYKSGSLVAGISCKRCHGPGREHVEKMRAAQAAGGIINPAKLPRERQIEVCAQCHGGHGKPLEQPFSYIPGKELSAFLRRDAPDPALPVDVHGNQVALLQMSRCYQSSDKMTCSTCHDVHTTQRDAQALSQRCVQCHTPADCGLFTKTSAKIRDGCVDCHMPVQPSNLIVSDNNGKQARAKVRSHWIKIYPTSQVP